MSKNQKEKRTNRRVTLLYVAVSECYVAVSEDRNVGWSQAKDTFWVRLMHEFNRKNFQKRTKDMLTRKWSTFNHHCQKFNAIYKRCHRLKRSGENEVDLMGRARVMYQDESRNSPFNHEKAWAILRQHAKWDAPEVAPVDLTEDETGDFHATVNTNELFGADPRPRPSGKQRLEKKSNPTHRRAPGEVNRPNSVSLSLTSFGSNGRPPKRCLRRRKTRTRRLNVWKELQFLALSMKDLSDDDVYWIEGKKAQIKAKLRAEMPMEPNNEDDSDE
uniref:Glutathione S-transferase T3-like n=1 Tax=Tanacetum cinerariifolium TaxID=118510 RepID=A0A699J983_TANCI|nr:hypothetical protein [Tanacetum cinerariifolium]